MWWWEPQEPPKTSMTAKPASAAAAYIQRRLDYVGLKNFQILRLSKTATPQKQTQTFDSSKLFWVRVASYRFCCCSAVFLRIFHSQAMWQMTAKKSCGAWKKMMEVGSFLALLAVFVQFFRKNRMQFKVSQISLNPFFLSLDEEFHMRCCLTASFASSRCICSTLQGP